MTHPTPVNWQPISKIALIASMIDGALDDTHDHMKTLTEARAKPDVLDDATIDRVDQVHLEQLEFVDIYAQQIRRWRTENPSTDQDRELDRMEKQNQQLRIVTEEILTLARELRKGTIDRILGMNDVELGLRALRNNKPTSRS